MTSKASHPRPFTAPRCLLLAVTALAVAQADAQKTSRASVDEALRSEVGVTWQNARLCASIRRLVESADLPVFIDRRVDTELRVSLTLEGAALSRALDLATAPHGLGYATLGPVVYIGPAKSAEALHAVGPRGRLPRVFREEATLEWPRLMEPRRLISSRLPRVGPLLENPDAIPHDLWPASGLPEMPRRDQLTLLLIGFDLTWSPVPGDRSGAWRVEPIDYAVIQAPPKGPSTGSPRAREPRGKPKLSDQRFTIRVTNQPLRAVLEQIAERVGLGLEIEPAAVSEAEQPVTFAVSGATLEELVKAASSAAGLNGEVSDTRILVAKRTPPPR